MTVAKINNLLLPTFTISLGPGFSDKFSIGSESAMVFSVVLFVLQKDK